MKDQRELDAYLAAYTDDDDNVRGDYPAAIRTIVTAVRDIANTERERDEVAGRLSALLCDLTGGRLSKPTYDVPTMAQEIEQYLTEQLEIDAEAEVDRLRAEIADRESERADLRDRVTKAEAIVARVGALAEKWSKRHPNPEFGAWTTWAADNLRAALDGGDDE